MGHVWAFVIAVFPGRGKARAHVLLFLRTALVPQVSEGQYKKVLSYIQAGKDEGATLLTGGGRPSHISAGYFVAPTVFTGVKPGMRVWREEIFGPVSVGGRVLGTCHCLGACSDCGCQAGHMYLEGGNLRPCKCVGGYS